MSADTPAALDSTAKRELETGDETLQNSDTKRSKVEHSPPANGEPVAKESASSSAPDDTHRNDDDKGKKGKKGGDKLKEWVRSRRGTRPEGEQPTEGDAEKVPRLPKRQCALLIGFCGSGYRGMQIQPEGPTIEGVLFKSLVAAGAVSKDNADDPVKVGLQRAARTDAGVHAAGNAVSMKMITRVPGIPDLIARINEELPPEIRLWSFQRVQNSFNARLSCDSRKYTYFFPSYLLVPPKPNSAFYQSFVRQSSPDAGIKPDPFWQDVNLDASREDMVLKKLWRVNKEKVQTLREAAKHFEGTHNFHNFTVGRDVKDRSCMRHLKKIEVADPVVYGETEWISVMLHGQSFMLHQRKMMCVLVMAVRTGTPSSIIDALYGSALVVIPKMPSLGLLLESPIFESYNKRVENTNQEKKFDPQHPDYRAPIDFSKHFDEMQQFKEGHIYKRMRESEEKLQIFDRWQAIFDHYNGNDLLYYNAQGNVPEATKIKKGQSRPNPFRERKRFDATDFALDLPAIALTEEEVEEVDAESDEDKMGKRELEEAEG